MDKEHKAAGFTHRINASVHTGGDDVEAVIYMVEATYEKAILELVRQTGYETVDFIITSL